MTTVKPGGSPVRPLRGVGSGGMCEWREVGALSERGAEEFAVEMEHAEMIKKRDQEEKSMEVVAEDAEDGVRKTVKMMDPAMPNEEEKREHEMTHVPYRSWCRHCVRGRGKEMNHKKSEGQPTMTEIHMDLCCPGEEDGSGSLTVLVARDRVTRMTRRCCHPRRRASSSRREW